MNSNKIIECHKLTANVSPSGYKGEALDFDIERGHIIVLTGPDNCGENDWMKTMGGIYYPLSGKINFFGKEAHQFNNNERSLLRKNLAYVTAELNLLSMFNGLANVMLPAKYHKLDNAEQIRIKALNLISELNINGGLDLLPADMHKDQRFLLTVARALMLDPVVLFLEQPFFKLDAASAKQFMYFLLHKVKQDNMTIIVSTQDFSFIRQYADQVLFISLEKLVSFDSTDDFLNCNDKVVSKYIGETDIL